jgi:ubiquinone/menaquinone biosynthesis C-methylase UbiE
VDHSDHVSLLRPGIAQPTGDTSGTSTARDTPSDPASVWADIGAGDGAFTLALADLLGPGAHIVAVDRDARALNENSKRVARAFPGVDMQAVVGDFRADLAMPSLDGLIAANSLHFVAHADQPAVIARLARHLKPGGVFVVVEYDTDSGNRWVPFPFAARSWPTLAQAAGLVEPRHLARVPSRFLGGIYSACAQRSRD